MTTALEELCDCLLLSYCVYMLLQCLILCRVQLQCLQVFAGNAETVQTLRMCARNLLLPCPTSSSYPHLLHTFVAVVFLQSMGKAAFSR